MAIFTDTQLLILSTAAQRDDFAVELPSTITEATAKKVVSQFRRRGFLDEVAATGGMPVWRRGDDGAIFSVVITEAGLDAIGIAPGERSTEGDITAPSTSSHDPMDPVRSMQARAAKSPVPERAQAPREGSKLDGVLALLRQPGGASVLQMIEATGWLPHTTRAALTGLRKRGYSIERAPGTDGNTTYHIGPSSASKEGDVLSGASMPA